MLTENWLLGRLLGLEPVARYGLVGTGKLIGPSAPRMIRYAAPRAGFGKPPFKLQAEMLMLQLQTYPPDRGRGRRILAHYCSVL